MRVCMCHFGIRVCICVVLHPKHCESSHTHTHTHKLSRTQIKDDASGRDYYFNAVTGTTQWEVIFAAAAKLLVKQPPDEMPIFEHSTFHLRKSNNVETPWCPGLSSWQEKGYGLNFANKKSKKFCDTDIDMIAGVCVREQAPAADSFRTPAAPPPAEEKSARQMQMDRVIERQSLDSLFLSLFLSVCLSLFISRLRARLALCFSLCMSSVLCRMTLSLPSPPAPSRTHKHAHTHARSLSLTHTHSLSLSLSLPLSLSLSLSHTHTHTYTHTHTHTHT